MKKKRGSERSPSRPSANCIELLAVAEERMNAKIIDVFVDGRELSFKVDTGAEVSVVPSSFPGVQSPEG